jgi:predicted lipid-binding transport protein (Tim44 family)
MNKSIVSQILNDEKVNKHNSANIKETWTFEKNMKSSDLNWKVSEINRPN